MTGAGDQDFAIASREQPFLNGSDRMQVVWMKIGCRLFADQVLGAVAHDPQGGG